MNKRSAILAVISTAAPILAVVLFSCLFAPVIAQSRSPLMQLRASERTQVELLNKTTATVRVQPEARREKGPSSVADIAEKLQDAVVNISTTQKLKDSREVSVPKAPKGSPFEEFFQDFFDDQNRGQRTNSLGSGFIIDSSGLIVTNNHVIEGADEITAILTDGTKLKVTKIVGRDAKTDLALLKIEPKKPLTAVKFGNSQNMRVGDWVMAIGNPFGLGGTVTVGVISATKRDINAGHYDEFIQTDAAINRGNSGGPLFNMKGEVIGVNTAIISPTGGSIGIGFALPSSTAARVIEQLKNYGETRRGWLGVRIQTINNEIADSLGMETASGALVSGVTSDGPAASAGIEVSDVILKFDGQTINAMRMLPKLVAQTPVGKEVEIVILHKGKHKTLKVKISRMEEELKEKPGTAIPPTPEKKPKSPAKLRKNSSLGMTLAPIDSELRARFDIADDVKGVVVLSIDPGSSGAKADVTPGSVILEVTQQKIRSPEDLSTRVAQLRKLKRKTALLLLSDGRGELSFVAVGLDEE
ncbi:MAG: Do family serine endopeptidase [Alphaproteobacteria bacterium]